jgi:hypothetical protein
MSFSSFISCSFDCISSWHVTILSFWFNCCLSHLYFWICLILTVISILRKTVGENSSLIKIWQEERVPYMKNNIYFWIFICVIPVVCVTSKWGGVVNNTTSETDVIFKLNYMFRPTAAIFRFNTVLEESYKGVRGWGSRDLYASSPIS